MLKIFPVSFLCTRSVKLQMQKQPLRTWIKQLKNAVKPLNFIQLNRNQPEALKKQINLNINFFTIRRNLTLR